jgi:hypothetical protein
LAKQCFSCPHLCLFEYDLNLVAEDCQKVACQFIFSDYILGYTLGLVCIEILAGQCGEPRVSNVNVETHLILRLIIPLFFIDNLRLYYVRVVIPFNVLSLTVVCLPLPFFFDGPALLPCFLCFVLSSSLSGSYEGSEGASPGCYPVLCFPWDYLLLIISYPQQQNVMSVLWWVAS